MRLDERTHDLLIVGAGAVGLTMAAVWSQLGRSAVVVEKHEEQYGLPRAGHIDHEIMRLLQTLDAEQPTLEDAYETVEYRWVNGEGETLLEFPWGEEGISGWHSDFMQNSAILEASLLAAVRSHEDVAYLGGWQAVALRQQQDHVELAVERTRAVPGLPAPELTGEQRVLKGRYLVACDGANSRIRGMLGVEREDLGFNEKWLVLDARRKREFTVEFDSGQICDPRRPTTVLPLGKHHRRWEWHIKPTEDPGDFTSPERAWQLLADLGIGADDVVPVRQLVYTFEARLARSWREDRVFLAGDAAHTMPPFMGQGMCSGMRDVKNLAWKLDLVLAGQAGPELLDTYQTEREPHVRDWTVISIEAGKIPCIVDPDEARRRDAMFRAGYRPPIPSFPQLVTGILHRDDSGSPLRPAGELGLQGRISIDGRIDLMDRLLPHAGFRIVSTVCDPRAALRSDQLDVLESLAFSYVHLVPAVPAETADDGAAAVVDVDRTYASYLEERGIAAVINRPDFYVFGGAPTVEDLPALVDDLLRQVQGQAATRLRAAGDR
jgi:2-polyprenyl-6-methoxyphenol hydroxylase-like FAD-dependent oxidoreductase